jgi:ferrous iron transport protein B
MMATNKPLVALIGNPNCGKTTLFNQLTGLNKKTGNWSGVTVDSTYCSVNFNELDYNLVDLPGIYGLSIESQGQDESHVHDFLAQQNPDLIINVINATSLERGLFLTLELLQFKVPIVTVLNMWDEAQQQNIEIDTKKLAKKLASPVITMVASTGVGIDTLKNKICEAIQLKSKTSNNQIKETEFEYTLNKAKEISSCVLSQPKNQATQISKLDTVTTHPLWGMLSFFFAMYVMFFFAINVSAVFIDFFDLATGAVLINGGHQLFDSLGFPSWLTVILADGIGGGIQTVATFIPVIGFLYLVLTWLEDSGYMARAAFVMNGVMQKIGLSGQAFVPLIVSFGCNVPAIMATRTLPSRRERLVTIMMAPFMSCGARLSVYALFVAAFFSNYAALIVFALYFTGIIIAVLTGLMLQKTILPGKAEPFLIELPPWRLPTFKNLIIGTWSRLKSFLVDAGKIIIIMVMLIQVFNSIGKDFSFGNQDSENSMLSVTAKAVVPIFEPMGIDERNWPAIVGILTGVLAKEVVVGTLDAIYTSLDKENNNNQQPVSIKQGLINAVVSIKDNTIGLKDLILDPLGFATIKAKDQGVNSSLFGIIRDRFADKYAAFAYLLFILLYFPCVAATAAIAREAGIKWAIFSGTWSTGLAYFVATNFYQLSHFSRHPLSASLWLLTFIGIITLLYFYLKKVGKRVDSIQLKVL